MIWRMTPVLLLSKQQHDYGVRFVKKVQTRTLSGHGSYLRRRSTSIPTRVNLYTSTSLSLSKLRDASAVKVSDLLLLLQLSLQLRQVVVLESF
ncbi:hypothetical protein ACFX19_029295 [Malus domestica]